MDVAAQERDGNKELVYDEGSKYVTVFDPLDGSSNVDAGIPTGTCVRLTPVRITRIRERTINARLTPSDCKTRPIPDLQQTPRIIRLIRIDNLLHLAPRPHDNRHPLMNTLRRNIHNPLPPRTRQPPAYSIKKLISAPSYNNLNSPPHSSCLPDTQTPPRTTTSCAHPQP